MLTPEQKKAVEATDRFILVKAGAGTGKTEVMARRIIHLLSSDPSLSIQQMAVITFTNKATENLMSRLKHYLYGKWKSIENPIEKKRFRYELECLNSSQISTIHKFCKSILDEAGPIHFDDLNYSPVFRITESSLNQAIDRTLEEWLHEKEVGQVECHHEKIMPVHNIKDVILSAYNMLRSQGISIEKAIQLTTESYQIETGSSRYIKQELVELISLLNKKHLELRYQTLDPDNLLEYCYKLLRRNPSAANALKNRYRYIFVDEFQDTSMYQTGIIKQLCDGTDDSPSLFVVGDSKQSIYQFRGADLHSYESVEKWISRDGNVLSLSTNFRSTGELVFYVNYLFEKIKQKYPEYQFKPEPLVANKSPQEPIAFEKAYTWIYSSESQGTTQPQIVAAYIKEQVESGVPPSKFAILFRKNYPMMEYAQELEKLGIPYQLIGAGNFYNQREIVDTYKLVNFLLNSLEVIYKEEAAETIFFKNDFNKLEDLLQEVGEDAFQKTPAQLLELIYQKTQIRERLITTSPQAVANLNKLKELSRNLAQKENLQIREFVGWLSVMIATHKEEQQSDIPVSDEINAVTLITIHKAKGLEYPIVILPELHQALSRSTLTPPIIYNKKTGIEFSYTPYFGTKGVKIPSSNYENTVQSYQQDLYSEELRVLYVALTRAEEHLIFVGDEDCPKKTVCFQNWLRNI